MEVSKNTIKYLKTHLRYLEAYPEDCLSLGEIERRNAYREILNSLENKEGETDEF